MIPHKGLLRYVLIAVLILLGIPVGIWIFIAGDRYHFSTPGAYAVGLFPEPRPGESGAILTRFVTGGLVNSVSCYVLIYILVAAAARLRRKRDSGAAGGRS